MLPGFRQYNFGYSKSDVTGEELNQIVFQFPPNMWNYFKYNDSSLSIQHEYYNKLVSVPYQMVPYTPHMVFSIVNVVKNHYFVWWNKEISHYFHEDTLCIRINCHRTRWKDKYLLEFARVDNDECNTVI